MEIIRTDSLEFHETVSWLGWENELMTEPTDSSTLETFYAYLSKLSGIAVAVLCRKSVALFVTAIIYCAVFRLGLSLFRDEQGKMKALIMLAGYIALAIIFNSVFDSVPYRQIMTPWHGKTIVCAVIFPLIMSVCLDIYSHDDEVVWSEWIYLAIIITASISVSIIGVNFTVIYCVVMAGPLIIYRLIRKKKIKHLILPAFVAALPAIIFSGIALASVITSNSTMFTRFDQPDWDYSFYKTFKAASHSVVLYLFLAAMLYFLIRGNKQQKLMIVGTTAFLFATFLNPILLPYVSKYITTGDVYWRLYWIIPIWTAIPAAGADALIRCGVEHSKAFLKGTAATLVMFFIILYAFFGTLSNNFLTGAVLCWYPARVNPYGLSYDTISCADLILEDSAECEPRLLDLSSRKTSSSSEMFAIRQYSVEIDFCVGIRAEQVEQLTDIIDGEDISVASFVNDICTSGEILDAEMLENAVKHMNADYVYAPAEIIPTNDFLELMQNFGDHVLLRVELNQ